MKFTIEATEDLAWSLQIGQHRIDSHSKQLGALPQTLLSPTDVKRSIDGLESLHFCTGNEDARYFPLQAARKGVFKDSSGPYSPIYFQFVIVTLYTGSTVVAKCVKDFFSFETIRSSACEILVQPSVSRCDPCKAYRKVLNSLVSRQKSSGVAQAQSPSQPQSHANFRFLNTPQRKRRFERLRAGAKVSQQKVKRLQERLEKVIVKRGMEVDADLHEDLVSTVKESTPEVEKQYPPDSFHRVFWEQQKQAMEKSDARSMRWEPAMIRSVGVAASTVCFD